ncbi:hypothetical protein [Sphingopyxis sp. 2PD]|nr:hypothetical protein [Sphingopyxis sp. 2PD]
MLRYFCSAIAFEQSAIATQQFLTMAKKKPLGEGMGSAITP